MTSAEATQAKAARRGNSRDAVVKSAGRVLRILELFDRRRAPANAHAVAVALGYPQSSTSALLRSLVAIGYLHYDRRARVYTPTLRVPLLGADWVSNGLVAGGAMPRLLNALAERSGATVALVARNGDAAEFVHVLGPRREQIAPGASLRITDPGIGRALLAALPEKEVRGLVHRLNATAAESGAGVLRIPELLAELVEIRAHGAALAVEAETATLATCLSLDEPGGPYAVALLLPAAALSSRRAELAAMMREEIARHLGATRLRQAAAESAGMALPGRPGAFPMRPPALEGFRPRAS